MSNMHATSPMVTLKTITHDHHHHHHHGDSIFVSKKKKKTSDNVTTTTGSSTTTSTSASNSSSATSSSKNATMLMVPTTSTTTTTRTNTTTTATTSTSPTGTTTNTTTNCKMKEATTGTTTVKIPFWRKFFFFGWCHRRLYHDVVVVATIEPCTMKKGENISITTIDPETTTTNIPSFLRLAREYRFDDIITILLTTTTYHQTSPSIITLSNWLQVQQHESQQSSTYECLHALCLYQPTPMVVQVVIDTISKITAQRTLDNSISTATTVLPGEIPSIVGINHTICDMVVTVTGRGSSDVVDNVTLVTDIHGRTPLHIAVGCGCTLAVLDVLLQNSNNNNAVYIMDHIHRYPLHYACTCSYLTTKSDHNSSKSVEQEVDNVIQIITRLVEIYPMALLAKDTYNCTPFDIAQSVHADKRILDILQQKQQQSRQQLKSFTTTTTKRNSSHQQHPDDDAVDDRTIMTNSSKMTNFPIREAICIHHHYCCKYNNNDNDAIQHDSTMEDNIDDDDDDISSIGSRGVSKTRYNRRRIPTSNHLRELVDI